ncbi:MAG: hypothetical protein WED05_06230 [Candidatus Atabeyarchaeum deiterrae]
MNRTSLRDRYSVILVLMFVWAVIYRVIIMYPFYANGYPAGFDSYLHAGMIYNIANNGFQIPTAIIYPPFFYLTLGDLYVVTGVHPLWLIAPYGIIVDSLAVFPMYYIAKKIADNNRDVGLLAAFFQSLNPITLDLLCSGTIPNIIGFLWLLLLISVLVSDLRNKPVGIIMMGILTNLLFLTHILVAGFYGFLFIMIFFWEVALRKGNLYFKPMLFSILIAIPMTVLYYLPRVVFVSLGGTGTAEDILAWTFPILFLTPILCSPWIFLIKREWSKRYVSRTPHINLLKLWYAAPLVITFVFLWQIAIYPRMWYFFTFPDIVILAAILTRKFVMMRKVRGPRSTKKIVAAFIAATVICTFIGGTVNFNGFFNATPERLALIQWTRTNTPPNAVFCTEEEHIPTHLGWYITALTGKSAHESLSAFSAVLEVGSASVFDLRNSRNITTLTARSQDWNSSVRALQVTYVILLVSVSHPNYAPIASEMVYSDGVYFIYNVTAYTYG